MSKDNGGPAFPVSPDHNLDGMTIRDYFAAKVIQGFCVYDTNDNGDPNNWNHSTLAKAAYKIADAMLAERNN